MWASRLVHASSLVVAEPAEAYFALVIVAAAATPSFGGKSLHDGARAREHGDPHVPDIDAPGDLHQPHAPIPKFAFALGQKDDEIRRVRSGC